MKKLVYFSEVSAYIFIMNLIILLLEHFIITEYTTFIWFGLSLVISVTFLIWFILLLKSMSGKTPLRLPAIIGLISFVINIIVDTDYIAIQFYIFLDSFSTLFESIGYLRIISEILFLISFCWLAYYFKKGSLLQILAICSAVIPFIMNLIPRFMGDSYYHNSDLINIYYPISLIIKYGLYTAFMFSFARIKTRS